MAQWTQSTVYTGTQNPPNTYFSFSSVASDSNGTNLCSAYVLTSGSQYNGSGLLVSNDSGASWGDVNSNNQSVIFNDVTYNSDGRNLFGTGYSVGTAISIINKYINNGRTVDQVTNPSPSPYWSSVATDSTGTTLVVGGILNNKFAIWNTSDNGSNWTTSATISGASGTQSTTLAVNSTASTIIVTTPGTTTTTSTTTTVVTSNTTNSIYVSTNSGSIFTQVSGLPSINWTGVACSYDGTVLLVSGNTTTTTVTTTTNPQTGQPQTYTDVTNTNGVIYLSINGGTLFNQVTSSSLPSSSSNAWYSVAIASNSNGTNGLFVAGSSGIYVSYGSTGSSWTNIITTPNIYYMTCNSDANFVFYNSNSNILYTARPTSTKYKGKTTLTSDASKGATRLDATAPANTAQGDLAFITDPASPYYYQLTTVEGVGSIYIYEALKQSYPAGSSIYIYPPNTTLSEILAEQNLPIPIADICFVRNTPIETDQGIVPIHKIDPSLHTINNKKIITITKSVTEDKFLVCFEKHSLGENIPSARTIVSKYHKIQNRKGKMMDAYKFLECYEDVKKIDYDGDILYNILMDDHETVNVNNLVCETLHPDHDIAKLYKNNYSDEYTNTVIAFMNYSKKVSTFKKG
jgi:hypothetical protein